MQIHDLNTKAITSPAWMPFDDGTDTYKADFSAAIDDAAAAAVADADLTDNEVAFTSGDAASPTAWSSVSVLTSGSTLATLFNKISTMVKNIRYLYNVISGISQIETGYAVIARAAGRNTVDITFGKAFSRQPNVFCFVHSTQPQTFFCAADSVTTTGFQAILYNNGAAISSNTTIRYIAIR